MTIPLQDLRMRNSDKFSSFSPEAGFTKRHAEMSFNEAKKFRYWPGSFSLRIIGVRGGRAADHRLEKFQGKLCFQGKRILFKNSE